MEDFAGTGICTHFKLEMSTGWVSQKISRKLQVQSFGAENGNKWSYKCI